MSHGAGAPRLRGEATKASAAGRRRVLVGFPALFEEAAGVSYRAGAPRLRGDASKANAAGHRRVLVEFPEIPEEAGA